MKNILIPTDFSTNSLQAIEYSVNLFKNEKCSFYFLNTYLNNSNSFNALEILQAGDEWFDKPREESLEELGKLVEAFTMNSIGKYHNFYAISEWSNLVEGIKKKVELLDIDLVILFNSNKKEKVKNNESIMENVRSCPILVVQADSSICEKVHLTIASNFEHSINTNEIEIFCEVLSNTNIEVSILVLDEQNMLSEHRTNNLEKLIGYMKKNQERLIEISYAKSSYHLKQYGLTHHDEIVCLIDEKPGLLRKLGLFKSNIISTLKKMGGNTILAIHE